MDGRCTVDSRLADWLNGFDVNEWLAGWPAVRLVGELDGLDGYLAWLAGWLA